MADGEDENFPPEVQIVPSKFAFREIHPLTVTSSETQPEFASIRSNLLAVANIYGYVFVALQDGIKVFKSSDLLEAGAKELEKVENVVANIELKNSPNWIGINSDNLSLAVCCMTDRGPQILFFDIRNVINKAKPTKTPFHSVSLNKNPNASVTSMCWNPSSDWPNLLAICVSTGSFHLFSIENTATEIAIRPDNFGAATVCWSPKGIQMIVGKKDGTLHQFTQKLEVRRSITVSDVIDRPVRAVDILWLSTHQITTAYVASDEEEDNFTQPNLFLTDIPSKNEQRDIEWKNYEDPCFGYNESRDSQYYFTFVDQWQMFVALSSNSTDSAVIAKNNELNLWEIWSLDDSARANLPLSQFTEEDTSPLGSVVITTAKDRIVVDDARECDPQPVLAILTNDGILCMYHMINLMEEYLNIVSTPKTLDLIGERALVGSRTATVSEVANPTTPSTSSTKQKLTAKPSINPMMTPKMGSNIPGSSFITSTIPMPLLANKSQFSASTPIVGKPPPFSEGPSIIQGSSLTPQPKPPLMRETLLKASPFAPQKHPALDETADTVFDANRTGSNESVFTAKSNENKVFPKPSVPPPNYERKPEIFKPVIKPPDVTVASLPAKIPATLDAKHTKMPLTKTKSVYNGGGGGFSGPKFTAPHKPEPFPAIKEARTQPTAPVSTVRKPPEYKSADPDLASTLDDVASFEKELRDFQSSISSTQVADDILGGGEEKLKLQKQVESMTSFSREISKTAHELNNEIQESSTSLLSLISETKDVGRKQNQTNVGAYRSLLYSRPLDRTERQKMEAIQGLYQYVVSCVREANISLDTQWEEANKRKKALMGMKDTRKGILQMGEWEAAYQGLKNNMKILHNQEMQVMLLSQELYKLKLETATSRGRSDRIAPVPETVRNSDDLRLLADTLLLQKTNESALEARKANESSKDQKSNLSRTISPKKQAQLGQILANRKVAPVRSSGRSPSSITRPAGKSLGGRGLPSLSIKSKSSVSKTPSEPISPLVEESSQSESTSASEEKTPESTSSSAPSENGFMFGDPTNQYQKQPIRQSGFGLPPSQPVQVPAASFSSIPQGAATFAYGAPKSVLPETKRRELSNLTASNIEAASNLNNPPQVVNIQKLQEPDPIETSLPEKFEPQSKVPVGAIEVVQAVINTVKAEKQQKPKEWSFGGATVPDKTNLPFAATDTASPGGIFQPVPAKELAKSSLLTGSSVFGVNPPVGASNTFPGFLAKERSAGDSQKEVLSTRLSGGNENRPFAKTVTADLKEIATDLSRSKSASAIPQTLMSNLKKSGALTSSTSVLQTTENSTLFGSKPNPLSTTGSVTPAFGSKPTTSVPSTTAASIFGFKPATPTFTDNSNTAAGVGQAGQATTSTQSIPSFGGAPVFSTSQSIPTSNNEKVFGGDQKLPTFSSTATTSIFGTNQGGQTSSGGSLFGEDQNSPTFGGGATSLSGTTSTQSIPSFGGAPVFSTSQSIPTSNNEKVFGGDQKLPTFSSTATTSIFGTNQGGQTSSGVSVFGADQNSPTFSGGATSIFGTNQGGPTSSSGSVFGASQNIQPFGSGSNLFGSKPATPTPTSTNVTTASISAEPNISNLTITNVTSLSTSEQETPGQVSVSSPIAQQTVFSLGGTTATPSSTPTSEESDETPVHENSQQQSTSDVSTTVTSLPIPAFTSSSPTITSIPSTTTLGTESASQPVISTTSVTSAPGGLFQTSTSVNSPFSSSSLFQAPPTSETSSPFGGFANQTSQPAAQSSSVFGVQPTSEKQPTSQGEFGGFSSPAFGSSASVFGSKPAPAPFGGFGTTSVFGSATSSAPEAAASQSVFGASTSVFGAQSGFGAVAENKPVFGGDAGGFGSKPAFGSTPFGGGFGASQPSPASQPSAFGGGGGFFTGLGGKPSQDAASKNPFQVGGTTEQEDKSGASLFGNSGAKSFQGYGQTQQPSTFGFGGASGGVGSQGFGGFGKPQQSGFGAAPAFGSSAAFGSPPAFGSTVGSHTFGGGFGSQPQTGSTFGQSTADSGGGGFASFAKNESPGFGNIASGGFGSPQPSNTFGNNAFGGGANTQKSPSFSGWR